jgi:protein gp37
MNKTKIETCDFTWNPVIGCEHGCPYCYARPIAEKIYGSFKPRFLPERLKEPAKTRKPSRIFVTSMGDLFGDWVSDVWICSILNYIQRGDMVHHTYQFLTKNPKRLKEFNPWPPNCWVGTTITNQADVDERVSELLKTEAPVRFISHEPILERVDVSRYLWLYSGSTAGPWYDWTGKIRFRGGAIGGQMISHKPSGDLSWAIIGAMTGPGAVKPKPEWVMDLAQQYKDAGVPLFFKDNLGFKDQPQEWPT